MLIPSLNNSLLLNLTGNVFGKTDFFPAFDTFSADSSSANCFPTHTKKTQMTVIEHLHKLANTGMRLSARWLIATGLPWQQIMQQCHTNLPQKKKTTLDKCMQVGATFVLQGSNTHKRQYQQPWEQWQLVWTSWNYTVTMSSWKIIECSVYSFSSSCPKTVSRTREVFPTGSTTLLRLQLSRTRDCAHRSRHVGLLLFFFFFFWRERCLPKVSWKSNPAAPGLANQVWPFKSALCVPGKTLMVGWGLLAHASGGHLRWSVEGWACLSSFQLKYDRTRETHS